MALILNIETATHICSVAVALDGNIISLREDNLGQSHARLLTTLIRDCVDEAGVTLADLHAVAVSKGPGSYTGLRIGVATAKGLCYGLDKPLVTVNTLQSLASVYLEAHATEPATWLCPMIDARRMEVYTAFFDNECEFMRPTSAEVIDPDSFEEIMSNHSVVFFGDGMAKTRKFLEKYDNAFFVSGIFPSATGMVSFTEKSYNQGEFEDIAYFEPFYLKDFFTGKQPGRSDDRP